jgi:squalene-associated FAD-dependent desaturase
MAGATPVREAVVVGGGWAGMAAAWYLAERAARVTLVERRPELGGRAFSFQDPVTGHVLDNGQHVLLGACTAVQTWLQALGLRDVVHFQRVMDVFVCADGRWARLLSRPWAGRFHLVPALVSYRHLRWADRLAVGRASWALSRGASDGETLGAWLNRRGQQAAAIRRFWTPVVTAVLNGSVDDVSAALAARAFRTGLAAEPGDARIGWFRRPLGEVAARIGDALQARGVAIRTGTTAVGVEGDGSDRQVRLADGTTLAAPLLVLAVPPDRLVRLVGSVAGVTSWTALGWSPIVNVYGRWLGPWDAPPWFGVVDGELVGFAFHRDTLLGEACAQEHWGVFSVSAADAWAEQPAARLVAAVEGAMARAVPALRLDAAAARVVWQRRATFRSRPGTEGLRPTDLRIGPGMAVAGDWTGTGWPASLESAVRSGIGAARTVWADVGEPIDAKPPVVLSLGG